MQANFGHFSTKASREGEKKKKKREGMRKLTPLKTNCFFSRSTGMLNWLKPWWGGLWRGYETRAQSFNAYTHTRFNLSAIGLINLDQITPRYQMDLIAFHPKLIHCYKNARYFAVLYYISQQQRNLKPSMEKMGLTVMLDSSLQERATRESHYKTTAQNTEEKE